MKRFLSYIGIVAGLIVSCSVQEEDFKAPVQDDEIFYASFEQPTEDGTRVYANEDLHLRWTANDRVSIFNKLTYNQQYQFTGETGDNAGSFDKVEGAEFTTGNAIAHVVSVYPYMSSTKISESEVISVNLPAEQHYAENTFGLGANMMVSVSSDNVLQYKSVGGFLMLKLYGDGVSVSSITLKGNNGEKLAGKASVEMPLNGTPAVTMDPNATTEITLKCASPVQLGSTAEESTQFWFVIPPVVFNSGFTVIIDQEFGVSTEKAIVLERNKVTKMAPLAVSSSHPNNVIYYTSSDGQIIMPWGVDYFGNVSTDFYESYGANFVSNEYSDGIGTITFDGAVKYIGNQAFRQSNLTSISLPKSVTSIGYLAFHQCEELSSITVPEQVTYIGDDAFRGCSNLTGITLLPAIPPQIGSNVFQNASSFPVYVPASSYETYRAERGYPSSWIVPIGVYSYISYTSFDGSIVPTVNAYNAFVVNNEYNNAGGLITYAGQLSYIAQDAFRGTNLLSITLPETITRIDEAAFFECAHLSQVYIPESISKIGSCAFDSCTNLVSVTLPHSVTSIGESAFQGCTSLDSITVNSEIPPSGGASMFSNTNNCPIYVPTGSVNEYRSAQYWSDYADRIYAPGTIIGLTPIVSAYFTEYTEELPDVTLLTHINYAHGRFKNPKTGDGGIVITESKQAPISKVLALKSVNPNLKVILSIGGWGADADGFSEMAKSSAKRTEFCQSVKSLIEQHELDGVDIDWEYPTVSADNETGSDPSDTQNLNLVLQELRETLGPFKIISIESSSNGKYIDWPTAIKYIDYVNVMTYDMGAAPNGHNSPLHKSSRFTHRSWDEAVDAHVKAGVPKGKLVMGIPFYGKAEKNPSEGTKIFDYVVKYYEIPDILEKGVYKGKALARPVARQWDATAMVPFLVDASGKNVLSYDDPESVAAKGAYVLANGLLGAMCQEYRYDSADYDLLNTLVLAIYGKKGIVSQ